MNALHRIIAAALLSLVALASPAAHASVVIGGTRVVYPAQDKEVTLKFINEGERATLVQVWLDDGDDQSTPDTAKAPSWSRHRCSAWTRRSSRPPASCSPARACRPTGKRCTG